VKGVISVSLGTSGVVFTAIDAPNFDPGGAAHTFCHADGSWHAMGVMLACGGALRWYRDTLGGGLDYDGIAAEAAGVAPGSEGLTFLPYLTGERCPHNDPFARAAFAGLTLGHTHAHLSRAVFEGVSYGLLDGMNLLKVLGATAEEIRVTGGGAKSKFWMQLLADLFGKVCVTLECDEGPAYGAAILAGVGVGVWPDVASACARTIKIRDRVTPSGVNYLPSYEQYQKLYAQTRGWNPV
jgi:xylulokinase